MRHVRGLANVSGEIPSPEQAVTPEEQLSTEKMRSADSVKALRETMIAHQRLMGRMERERWERERATERALLRALPEMVAAYRGVLMREMDADSANDIAMAYQRELLAKTSLERILDAAGVAVEQKGVAGDDE